MIVSLIAAVSENGVIGKNNDLPWQIKDDMKFFVATTKGHVVVTGRRNYEAMGCALPRRKNLVVSRDSRLRLPDATVFTSVEEALLFAQEEGEQEVFVIGGAQVYALAFPYATRFYRTRVLATVPGDVFFPQVDLSDFTTEELCRGEKSERNEHAFVVELLCRRGAPRPLAARHP